jgi:hypothetical protein
MTTTNEPAWIAVGAEAAVRSGSTHAPTIEFVRIERLTKTVMELADGRRFQRSGYRKLLGVAHSAGVQVCDPKDTSIVQAYARQMLRAFARQAVLTTDGSGATINTMDPEQVRAELDRLADLIDSTRKEVDRRAGL